VRALPSIAVHAVRLSKVGPGDTVAVLGAGPIGLLCMQVARTAGASRVFVSEAARRLGANAVVDPTESDVCPGLIFVA